MTKEEVETIVKAIVESQLREHERRCAKDRQAVELRLDARIDKLEKHMAYYAGAIGVAVFALQYYLNQ